MSLKNIKAMLAVCIAKEHADMEVLDTVRNLRVLSAEPMEKDDEKRNRAQSNVCRERARAFETIQDFIEEQ